MQIKTVYLTYVAIIFSVVFIKSNYLASEAKGWVEAPTYWYSLFYCTTMALFAWRRTKVKKTTYVKRQMITLVSIQVFFLFLMPFHLYDPIISFFPKDHWLIQELFPWGKWTCFSYILFWPLSCWQFGTSTFWTIFPFFQSGVFLYWLIKQYGKGAYCGWICSCGGMAETLGDEYRHLSPHGPKAKYLENIGQFVLAFATIVTFFSVLSHHEVLPKGMWLDTLKGLYKFSIDVFFAGVLGLGVYFFMGGRVWCRFGCPLAALMHIYTRFSKYRILSEKKKCISCNICTKVCHMGIDVMNFANKGVPMNDVECVRCSTCVTSCPMEVLSFDKLTNGDSDNKIRKEVPDYGKDDWRAGIK
jgi:polyferredoxin